MPSLRNLLTSVAPIAGNIAGGILNRRAASNATRTLADGADTAIGTIQGGTDAAIGTIQGGADRAGRTLADINGRTNSMLQPYVDAGQHTLADLEAGVAPGGGLADAFKWIPADLENDPVFKRRLQQGQAAIEAKGNAGGTRFTGASMKDFADYSTGAANDYLAQDYARQENTFRANQKDRLAALTGVEGIAQTGIGQDVAANNQYGTNLANLQTGTAGAIANAQQLSSEQIAELQTQKANAEASGDVAKANSINDILTGVGSTLEDIGVLDKLKKGASLASTAAPVAATAAGLGAAGTVAAGAGMVGSAGLPLGLSATGGLGAAAGPGIAAPALAPGAAGGGGFASTVGALATNPVTIAVAAGIIGVTALLKSQAHWEANTFVKSVQGPFGKNLGKAVDGFDRALASGQLDRATAQQARDSIANTIEQFEQARQQFATKGKDNKEVAENARREMAKDFGPNWELILGKMDREIAGLQ